MCRSADSFIIGSSVFGSGTSELGYLILCVFDLLSCPTRCYLEVRVFVVGLITLVIFRLGFLVE